MRTYDKGMEQGGAMATSQVAFLPSEADLRYAFEQRKFEVFYQPIVALQTGRLAAIEALMRWRHPDHGLLSAGRFIDVAEKTEFIVPLSEWIQHAVCAQIQAWSSAGRTVPIVGINMTTRQFRSGYFRAHLQAILNQTGVEPGQLAIEI